MTNFSLSVGLIASADDTNLVFADEVLAVDPRVVLHEELGAVFTLAQENLPPARMHLSILSDIVDSTLINCPAIILLIVLFDFLERVVD